MYQIHKYRDQFEMFELRDTERNAWFKVCPERGGIITSYGINGEEYLYLDETTFYDKNANIRGGIPILFPISGQLENGEYEYKGKTYSMKNHGFARTNPWEVVKTEDQGTASITIRLLNNEETKKSFPFDYELLFTYSLTEGSLRIDQQYINHSNERMPIYAGFHPYFRTEEKDLAYQTDATRYLDYNDHEIKPYQGHLDIDPLIESAALLDAKQNKVGIPLNNKKHISLEYGKEFPYLIIWSQKNKPFVCVEPWMAKNGEFHRFEEVQWIEPAGSLQTFLLFNTNI